MDVVNRGMGRHRVAGLALLLGLGLPLAACTSDPQYLPAPAPIEVSAGPMGPSAGMGSLTLPIERETAAEVDERAAQAAELGAPVPYVRMGDLDLTIEWTIKNLTGESGQARVQLVGANEWNAYVPLAFVVDPEEDEEPPPLAGNIPIELGPNQVRSGVLREDQLREATIDLELITRTGTNPFAAVLTRNEDDAAITVMPEGVAVPLDLLAGMIRIDFGFSADVHAVMEWAVRVRDRRGLLHRDLGAAPPEELTVFTPAEFVPPPPPP